MAPRGGGVPLRSGALVALALPVLLAGFLLGRRSQAPADAPPQPSPPPTLAMPASPVPPVEMPTEPPLTLAPATPPPVAEATTLGLPPASPPVGTPAPAAASEEVARYFTDADAIQARAKYWTDPQALAKTILEQAGKGDAGAFDDLIRSQRGARDDFARMVVPTACAEHHRRSLAVMNEGIELLERVRGALTSADLGAIDGLQERARALEREAKEIDELGRSLQQR